MTKLQLKFNTEPDNKLAQFYKEGTLDFDFWCRLDIHLDGKSFFRNFSSRFYSDNEDRGFKEHYINKSGISVPVFPFIESIIESTYKLEDEKNVVIEDHLWQTSIQLVAALTGEKDTVALAARISQWDGKYFWFDGKQVYIQKEIPKSENNLVKFNDFKNGCINSVKTYIDTLLDKYPELDKISYFNGLTNNV